VAAAGASREGSADHPAAAEALRVGSPDWPLLIRRAYGSPNNLTSFHLHGRFLDWVDQHGAEAARLLASLCRRRSVPDRVVAFRVTAFKTAYRLTGWSHQPDADPTRRVLRARINGPVAGSGSPRAAAGCGCHGTGRSA
jgi:hypothetical protein